MYSKQPFGVSIRFLEVIDWENMHRIGCIDGVREVLKISNRRTEENNCSPVESAEKPWF